MIMNAGRTYKFGQDLPHIDYNENETNLWKLLYTTLVPKIKENACQEYLHNFEEFERNNIFSEDRVPQMGELNELLMSKTNWRLKPVTGILSPREYLNCLAFRTFPCT